MTAHQEITFTAARWSNEGLPVYQPGQKISGTVTLVPDRDARARGVQMQVACTIHGSGSPETFEALPEHFVYQGDLQAGSPIVARFDVTIPSHAPLSYQGRRIKFDWAVRLRVDIPIWPDKNLVFPFIVEPLDVREG